MRRMGAYTTANGYCCVGGVRQLFCDANVTAIQKPTHLPEDRLSGFRPGANTNFSYMIVQNSALYDSCPSSICCWGIGRGVRNPCF